MASYSLQQLTSMGAKPIAAPTSAPAKSYSIAQLTQMGAKPFSGSLPPAPTTTPTSPVGSAGQAVLPQGTPGAMPNQPLGNLGYNLQQLPAGISQLASKITAGVGGTDLANQLGTRIAAANAPTPAQKANILATAPSALNTAKSAASVGLNVGSLLLPYGTIAGAAEKVAAPLIGNTAARIAGNVGASALGGYGFDVAQNLQNGTPALQPGVNTAIGAALPLGGEALAAGLSKLSKGSLGDASQYISDQYQKGVRPTVAGKSTGTQLASAKARQLDAVQAIVENKPNLTVLDAHGEPTNQLPTNLHEFVQAITQTKGDIFKQYDALQQAAGKKGVTLDLTPVVSELDKVAQNPVLTDLHPDIAKYADVRARALESRGSYTPEQAQEAIKTLNASLEAFYKNPSYDSATRAGIDSLIVNKMRAGLDDAIEGVKGAEGESYQALKRKYGALTSIEKDVTHRQIVDARKNPVGLVSSISNIGSAAELLRGIVTMNPADFAAGVGVRTISKYIEHLNNPNTAIKNLFRAAEKALANGEGRLSTATSLRRAGLPESGIASTEPTPVGGLSQVPQRFEAPGDKLLNKGLPAAKDYLTAHPPSLGGAI